ncbi:hypothetical protein HYH02_013327 [Chlamydomonas schloesseri]|uniref:FAD-dependent oxidoreductase 2 FAD-binding domain-containing protein n=1 Tax=Chlamydomonas schloesseri TaxID=2026947 RepID=A0A835VVX2_9CHLO|nr:hypothetical protein HYH02_013327 [Chlamydomonas schloesseri]|eukprot:KAG2431337.1 hypothetical protein HYH02_013327 [Chlamydomonas schloesseri]
MITKRVAGRNLSGSASCSVNGTSKRLWLALVTPLVGLVLLLALWIVAPPPTVIGTAAQAQAAQAHKSQVSATTADSAATGPGASSAAPAVATGRALVKQSQEQIREVHAQRQHQQQAVVAKGSTGKGSIRGSGGWESKAMSPQLSTPPASARVVVVGGGLAGLTAALTAAEQLAAVGGAGPGSGADGGRSYEVDVLVVEKMPRLGGNSAKASSGMNALNTPGGDSESLFSSDTLSSGGGASVPELVQRLVHDSPAALSFLDAHGVALPGVTQLGGHSVPRTRTVTAGANVGWAIMSALSAAVKAHPRIRVLEGVSLKRIVVAESEAHTAAASGGAPPRRPNVAVTSVLLTAATPGGASDPSPDPTAASSWAVRCGALVLATGGYAANRELLKRYAPQAADLATTNGPWAAGDALQLAEEAGAALVGLEDVQVHPTGFVDPADPESGTKFLAPEKLRGVGGLLLAPGTAARFTNELGRRDAVAAAVSALPGRTAWMLLGAAAAAEYGAAALGFYCSKGLMTKAGTLAEAADAMHVPEAALRETLTAYGRLAEEQAQRGGDGSGLADQFGKRVFRNTPHPDTDLPVYVARVTPVVHYTMGGVAINQQAQVLRASGPVEQQQQQPEEATQEQEVIGGLYAAGEVSGGVHGHNRLGGNSLLECVVYGRVAGRAAAAADTSSASARSAAARASSSGI